MTVSALFDASDQDWLAYKDRLPAACARLGVDLDLSRDHTPADVDYLIYSPAGSIRDFTPFTRAKAVLSLWAGVERIVDNPTLTQPLTRLVDAGLRQGMVEWVTAQVLRHHLGMDRHINGQDGVWRNVPPRLADTRPVTILGMGELGTACAAMLIQLGFPVTGWSRTSKTLPGLQRSLSGEDGLAAALAGTDIIVLLLPLTRVTENLMNAARLALTPPGCVLINPGRGGLIDDLALLDALDRGQIGHATLDVFRTEPLPPEHPYWAHPRVTVTPHIASVTPAHTAAHVIAENIRRGEAGEPFLYVVDRKRGY